MVHRGSIPRPPLTNLYTHAMKKAILNRINEINSLIEEVKSLDSTPTTYDGGTFPYEIDIEGIEIKNQFVYINENKSRYSYGFEKRYNTNLQDNDLYGLPALKHHLSVILKTFKKEIKNQ